MLLALETDSVRFHGALFGPERGRAKAKGALIDRDPIRRALLTAFHPDCWCNLGVAACRTCRSGGVWPAGRAREACVARTEVRASRSVRSGADATRLAVHSSGGGFLVKVLGTALARRLALCAVST